MPAFLAIRFPLQTPGVGERSGGSLGHPNAGGFGDAACTGIDERCDLPDQAGTCGRAAASAPTLTPRGLLLSALLLVSIAAVALRRGMRRR